MESSSQTAVCFSHPNRTLVIMAKAPKPGMVKTRLTESLPSPAVTALYRCLLEDTLALATSLTSVDVAVMCPESDQDELAHLLGNTVQVVRQKGEGLAAGLVSVFRHFTAAGRQHVIAFNSDSPHLAPSVLEGAFEILATHDVVIGPTHDGGYYLVGAKAAYPSLFEGDGMGTRSALDRLLTRTKVLELSTGFTEAFYDIDVANDLILLARELRLAPRRRQGLRAGSANGSKQSRNFIIVREASEAYTLAQTVRTRRHLASVADDLFAKLQPQG